MPKNHSKAFTLIETLVVVAIVGILISLSTVGLRGAQSSARDAQRKTDLQEIRSALEVYRTDCGSYPDTLNFGNAWSATCAGNNNTYMSKIPQDPQYIQRRFMYKYRKLSSPGKYELCAYLENPPSGTAGFLCGGVDICHESSGQCFYKVINP